jgi:DNA polymerase III subunit delta
MPTPSTDELINRLLKSKVPPTLLLLGKDAYLRDVLRERVIEVAVDPAARAWAVSRFSVDEGAFARGLAQSRTVPMLARRQVVILTEVEALEEMPEEKREAARQDLSSYFDDPAPFTILILEAGGLDERTKLAKMLLERAVVVPAELSDDPAERGRTVAMLASKMAREQNSAIEDQAAEELADLCNGDLAAVKSEIEKLATYVGAGQVIRREDVEALVVSEKKYTVWELADVLATRQRARAFQFLTNVLQQGEGAPGLVAAMAWMFRKLIEAQQLSPHTPAGQAAGQLGMRRATAELALRNARKIPRHQLVQGLRILYDADSRLKSGAKNDREVMEFLLGQLTA